MKYRTCLPLVFVLILTLSGCASMNQQECLASDWRAIGFEDASRGYTTGQFSKHHKACTKFGVTPDFEAYQAGRQEGLTEYCRPHRGYRLGARGKPYRGVCPAELEAGFLTAYRAGKRLYKIGKDIQSLENQIQHRQKELSATRERLATASAELISGDTTSQTREQLLAETLKLSKEQEELEEEILALERQKDRLELEHAKYKKTHSRFTY